MCVLRPLVINDEKYRDQGLIINYRFHGKLICFVSVSNGMLDLHGKATVKSWTKLSVTVNSGANSIELADAVDWAVSIYSKFGLSTGCRNLNKPVL